MWRWSVREDLLCVHMKRSFPKRDFKTWLFLHYKHFFIFRMTLFALGNCILFVCVCVCVCVCVYRKALLISNDYIRITSYNKYTRLQKSLIDIIVQFLNTISLKLHSLMVLGFYKFFLDKYIRFVGLL